MTDVRGNVPKLADDQNALIDQFTSQLWLAHGLSENTLASYGSDVRQLARFLQKVEKLKKERELSK